jgi:sugar phosphate permease
MNVAQLSPPDVAVAPSRRLARVAFAAMLAVYFFGFFNRSAVPGTIFNELQQEWHLSASAIVSLGSVYLWIYGSMLLVAGVSVDRFGGIRRLVTVSSI